MIPYASFELFSSNPVPAALARKAYEPSIIGDISNDINVILHSKKNPSIVPIRSENEVSICVPNPAVETPLIF